ncbi:N-acetylneuraminate lyase [Paenibacillus piri]|uniref:N-acetylneuraminate lyase n=1 Tax=Paenibacillus piri TaxID=2547395 RepID=A0A4R5KS61_9BACL|nr:N-acetylneuraminate lyase [Paenibacillus piri]TDF98683.1 N-acetylneuraminate lyase [Paenibacillus piri]
MELKASFKGIFTALVTPMHEDGSLDLPSLTGLVEHQLQYGIHGFYVGGSTGEGLILSSEERKQVLETVLTANRGRAKVVAHVGCISTDESIMLARHAEQAGADAISAVVPFYYKVGMNEIRSHYEAIMNAVRLPMLIYHFPGATGASLTMSFFEEMALHPQCLGVKFTSLNLFEMQQIRAKCGPDFLILNGHDEVYAAGALMGADGAIGSTMNMMPSLYTDMFDKIGRGDWNAVVQIQSAANEIIAHMLKFDVIPYEKYMLYLQGVIANPKVRQPLTQLEENDCAAIRAYYESGKVLNAYRK